jgi:Putative Ig domain/Immunoglobulin I-set domain
MSYRFSGPSQKEVANGNRFVPSAALISLLSCVLFFSACGASNPSQSSTTNPSALIVSANLPAASVGSAYSGNLTVSGGTAPYAFSTASGALPQGITLNNGTGAVAGTPTTSGSFSFAVSVSDSKGLSKQLPLQITVSSAAAPAVSLTPSSATVVAGSSAQFNAQVSNIPDTAVTWTASHGTISGSGVFTAPQVSASTTVTISAASVADPSVSASASITVTPPAGQVNKGSSNGGNSFSNLQRSGGWGQYGQGPPKFVDCSPSPCDGIAFWMSKGIDSPSMSGNASEFNVGGSKPYSDALWNNHMIGPSSSQGMFDPNHTVVPGLHDFTYDVYFFGYELGLSEALEFDINQFFGNMGFIFGHECRIAAGNEWDVWNNQSAHWVPTGIPCHPKSNSWNHLTIKVQRTSDNQLIYQSITLNGVTNNLNWTFGHGSAPGWYGVTVNYQMDGNNRQDPYNVYLDDLTFSYE